MKKGQSNKKRGTALVIVFMVLILIAGLSMAMFEVGVSTSKLSQSWVALEDAGYFARMGIHYYAHQIVSGSLYNSEGVLQELQKLLGQKKTFGIEGGWFRLDYVGKIEPDYLIRVSGGSLETLKSARGSSLLSFVKKAYAEDSTVAQFEALVGPRYEKVNLHLLAASLTNTGATNTLDSFGEKGMVLAPPDPQLTWNPAKIEWNDNSDLISPTIENIAPIVNQRISEAFEAFSKGFQNPTIVGTQEEFNNLFAKEGTFRSVPGGNWDFRILAMDLTDHLTFGSPGRFSYMKFNRIRFNQSNQVIRLYPGIYHFDHLDLEQPAITLYLDTTTGPVILIITKALHVKQKKSAVLVFKDLDYPGTPDYTQYSNRVDLAKQGQESPLRAEKGRKIAQIILAAPKREYADFKVGQKGIDSNGFLIGLLAVGRGGGDTFSLPQSLSPIEGSEVIGSSGNLLPYFQGPLISTESFQVWGNGSAKQEFYSSSSSYLVGNFTLLGKRTLWERVGEFNISGQKANVFGSVITNSLSFLGSSSLLSLDSRAAPLPPQPIPGSIYVKYSRQIR